MTAYRYQALGPLMAGGSSRAFLGLAISPDDRASPVVLIWVPEDLERDAEALAALRRETERAAKLDHPNIVAVRGFAELEEGFARVVEYADGESLRSILDASPQLPGPIAARVVCDACTGTHYAHVAGNDDGSPLVHGDLRPETILVGYGGSTKVMGYGALAFAPRPGSQKEPPGRHVYSTPEQLIGGRPSSGLATDVYLLGLCYAECLTGAVPWADRGDGFEHAVLTEALPPLPAELVPPALEPILRKACAKKASDRYATPMALREAIEAALPGQIASTEEVAHYLERTLPQASQLRTDRRRTIDAGIADFMRRQWAERPSGATSRATPAAAPLEAPKAPAAPKAPPAPLPKGRPPAPLVRPQPIEQEEEPSPAAPSRVMPRLLALAVLVSLGAGWVAWRKAHAPTLPAPARIGALDSPTTPAPDAPAATPPTATAATSAEAQVPHEDAAPSSSGATDERSASPASESDGGELSEVPVSLDSTPPVELLLDGKLLGRTPWSGRLSPGRKSFALRNKDLGIATGRTVTVKAEPTVERFSIERGSVALNAPAGATVTIDALKIGIAPIHGAVPVYEGTHRLTVTVGETKWTDSFRIQPRQHVNLNVVFQ